MSNITVKIGTTFRHVIADSNSLWEVVRKDGPTTWIAVVLPEVTEIGGHRYTDEWAGTEQAFTTTQITQKLRAAAVFTSLNDEGDRWWDARQDGETVHYSNGFGQFVRGRIETINGIKQMVPTALVGEWRKFDLPRRSATGEVVESYHSKRITAGEPMRPSHTTMFEARPDGKVDPRALPEVNLTLPEPTEEEALRHKAERLLADVATLARDSDLDPFERIKQIKAALAS